MPNKESVYCCLLRLYAWEVSRVQVALGCLVAGGSPDKNGKLVALYPDFIEPAVVFCDIRHIGGLDASVTPVTTGPRQCDAVHCGSGQFSASWSRFLGTWGEPANAVLTGLPEPACRQSIVRSPTVGRNLPIRDIPRAMHLLFAAHREPPPTAPQPRSNASAQPTADCHPQVGLPAPSGQQTD